nr:putative nuclease HARBI1 [Tanacetum cinerariifolium]
MQKEKKIIRRDLNFFSRALSFLVCLLQPKRQKRTKINRDHYDAHERLVAAYFSDNSMFMAPLFEERFRTSRKLFTSIVEEVTIHYAYFREKEDCTVRLRIFSLLKCTSAIRQLAYNIVPDILNEYLQMGYATARLSLEHFYRREAICPKWYPDEAHQSDGLIRSDEQRHRII